MQRERAGSAFAVDDAAAAQIVRRDFDFHAVTRHDSNEVLAHPSRDVRHHFATSLELDSKPSVGESLGDRALDFKSFFFLSQVCFLNSGLRRDVRNHFGTAARGRGAIRSR